MHWTFQTVIFYALYRPAACHGLQDSFVTRGTWPFELLVYREPETLECSHVSIRETQLFRNMPEEGYIDSLITEHGDEKIRFIHHDPSLLRREVQSLCRDETPWNHREEPSFMGGQTVLTRAASGHNMHSSLNSALELEIRELIRSGPSDNRVDLVFFSDGCTLFDILSWHILSVTDMNRHRGREVEIL